MGIGIRGRATDSRRRRSEKCYWSRRPSGLSRVRRPADLRLCDLDESIWDMVPPATIHELAVIILDRVAAGCARRVFDKRHFPRPPEGVTLGDLRLEHRTFLCLAREGFQEDLAAMGDWTIGDILAIRAFGPRCLVDLLSAMETLVARGGQLCAELTDEARRLADVAAAASVSPDDPRFSDLMRSVNVEARFGEGVGRAFVGEAARRSGPEVRRVRGAQTSRANRGDAPAEARGGADSDIRLDRKEPAELRYSHRVLRLEGWPATHAGRDRRPLRHDAGTHAADLRKAGQTQESRGDFGAGHGSRARR